MLFLLWIIVFFFQIMVEIKTTIIMYDDDGNNKMEGDKQQNFLDGHFNLNAAPSTSHTVWGNESTKIKLYVCLYTSVNCYIFYLWYWIWFISVFSTYTYRMCTYVLLLFILIYSYSVKFTMDIKIII